MKYYKLSSMIILTMMIVCSCGADKIVDYNKEISKQNFEISQLKDELKQDKQLIKNYETNIGKKDESHELQDYSNSYDQAMMDEKLKQSKYVMSLYTNELKRLDEVYDINIDKKILNLIQPEKIKIGDSIAGLVVSDASSNNYGYEYNIQFEGEFTVEVTLEYDPIFEQFFGNTEELDVIPYVSRCEPSTTFLIDDPNEILSNAKDGDVIRARFNNYKVRRMNGKPLSDVVTIIAIE